MEKIDLSVIRVNCSKCKCLVDELDWDNESLVDYVFSVFGSMDDYYFFPCECGEINEYHYTGYDCLLDEYEYLHGIQSNLDVQILYNSGGWERNHKWQFIDKVDLDKLLVGFDKFHFINSYENYTYYRKGLEFLRVTNNPIHKAYACHEYLADEDKVLKLVSHFGGVKR